jgi:hypothetical protein
MSEAEGDKDKEDRVRRLKEDLRKKHVLQAEFRIRSSSQEVDDDEDPTLTRFSKYRRSGSQKHVSSNYRSYLYSN